MNTNTRTTGSPAASKHIKSLLGRLEVGSRTEAFYHFLYELNLTPEDKAYVLSKLSPVADESGYEVPSEKLVNAEFIEDFLRNRSLGLSLADTAPLLGVTSTRLKALLDGEGLSAVKHKKLLQAEARSEALFKAMHLRIIETAAMDGNWRASMELLERRYPDEWGKQTKIKQEMTSSVTLSSSESEARALAAEQRLRELRNTM